MDIGDAIHTMRNLVEDYKPFFAAHHGSVGFVTTSVFFDGKSYTLDLDADNGEARLNRKGQFFPIDTIAEELFGRAERRRQRERGDGFDFPDMRELGF